MKLATSIAAVIAAFLIGLSFAERPQPASPDEPTPLSIEAFEEYQQLLSKSRDQQRQILSLEMDLAESKTKIESLTVQLAESLKARQRPEVVGHDTQACTVGTSPATAVPSVVPVYERRFRLFRGRR